jgi:hypothetical protein
MKFKINLEHELRPEYELSELIKTGVQGKYYGKYRNGTNLILLDPEVEKVFPDENAVNEALRLVIELTKIPKKTIRNLTEII